MGNSGNVNLEKGVHKPRCTILLCGTRPICALIVKGIMTVKIMKKVASCPGGYSLIYKPYKYVPSQRGGVLGLFGLKTGIHFAYYGSVRT